MGRPGQAGDEMRDGARRSPPFLAMPYPLDEYLDELPGDYAKIARRLLRAARWTRGEVDGIELDAGEALMDERSEKLWGELRLDRGELSVEGRRGLIRRVLERLKRDGIASLTSARERGPRNGPETGPRNGPSPTVVTFLKYREILWPASATSAQETAQGPAQETAPATGPIPPEDPPEPPPSLRSGRAAARPAPRDEDEPPAKQLEVLDLTIGKPPLPDPGPSPFQRVVAHWFEAWERAGRGKYSPLTPAEGATVKRLVRQLGADELMARMDRAFADPWFLEHGDLMLFGKQREKFARPGRAGPLTATPPSLPDPGCPEWGRVRARIQQRVRAEAFAKVYAPLTGEMRDGVLVVLAPDRYKRTFLEDNHLAFLTGLAREELGGAVEVRIEELRAVRPIAAVGAE